MRLENAFEVVAPVDTAWRLLNDVPSVVPCIPGAELIAVADERSWKVKLDVKLGPIRLQFATDVSREEIDAEAGRVVLTADAREARGRGSARARISSTVAPTSGGTRVDIVTELTLQGAVAQHGRGIVADVASRLTAQFAECVAARLADPARQPGGSQAPIGGLRLFLGALWRSLLRRPMSRQ